MVHVDPVHSKIDISVFTDPWKSRRTVEETKDTNPKQSFGDAKAGMECVPVPVLYELGLAMLEGALKYGRHNYRVSGVRMSTYYNAAKRHLDAWWEGEDIDKASGLPHLVKAMACFAVIRDAQMLGLVTDDRPPSHPDGWQDRLADLAAEIKSRYPEPREPFIRDCPPPAEI